MFSDNSEKEQKERIDKSVSGEELSDKDKKQEEDAEKGFSDAEEHKEKDDDSENTQSDDAGGSPLDAHGLDKEAVSSSDVNQLDEDKEESGQEAEEAKDMDSQPTALDKPNKKTPVSGSVDAELSDDELLVLNFIHIQL